MKLIWREILNLQFAAGSSNQVIARKIAQAIEAGIRNNSLTLGSPLPTTRQVAAHLMPLVKKGTVDMAWSILKNELKLIVTHSGNGTHVVESFSSITQEPVSLMAPVAHPRSVYFNSEFILYTDRTVKGLNTAILKAFKHYPVPKDYKVGNKIAPQLVSALLKVVNSSLCNTYKEEELYYAQSQQQLIHHICRITMSSRKIFVLADTASLIIRGAVIGAGYKVEIVKTDSSGIMMESLEVILRKGNVRIVYVRSRSAMPSRQALSAQRLARLLEMQKEFKFLIIDDDEYANFYEDDQHMLMNTARHMKAHVIYIRPVSRMHQYLADIHIVVAWPKLISLLSEKFEQVGKIIDSRLSYMLNELYRKKILPRYESRAVSKMGSTIFRARGLLLDSGLWKSEGLFCDNGWFFYLELKRGDLSADIVAVLRKEYIYVMDISDFDCSYVKNIIVLSTAAYLDGDHLEDDINRLNEVVNQVIKNRKNESNI